MDKRSSLTSTLRGGVAVVVVVTLLIVTVGLFVVVTRNLETSNDLQKESEESHLLSEIQVSLLAIDQLVQAWQLDPAGQPHVTEDPSFPSHVAVFYGRMDQLSHLIDAAELVEVGSAVTEFDNYVASLRATDGTDWAQNQKLAAAELSIRAPLQELLEEENNHLLESVTADSRSEEMLRWGLPLLLLLGIVVLAVVVRLENRSRMLDDAERVSEAKNEFIASVSHELRTPLTPIVALSMELRDRIDDFSKQEVNEFVDTIARESDRVSAIVDDLLVAARIEAGRLAVNPEVIELDSFFAHAIDSVDQPEQIRVHVAGLVYADRGRLTQIIRNLVSNARRYGGKRIEITSRPIDDKVLIIVGDSGPGIPAELSDRIFEPFTSAHQIEGIPTSVGLGLTVSRRLAQLMGGSLTYGRHGDWSRLNLTVPGVQQSDDPEPAEAGRVPQSLQM